MSSYYYRNPTDYCRWLCNLQGREGGHGEKMSGRLGRTWGGHLGVGCPGLSLPSSDSPLIHIEGTSSILGCLLRVLFRPFREGY